MRPPGASMLAVLLGLAAAEPRQPVPHAAGLHGRPDSPIDGRFNIGISKVNGIKVRKQTPPIAETLLHLVQAGAVDILATGALPDRIQPGASPRSHP